MRAEYGSTSQPQLGQQAQQFFYMDARLPQTFLLLPSFYTSRNLGHNLQLEIWMAACSLGSSVSVAALDPVVDNTTEDAEDIAFCQVPGGSG